MVMLLPSAKRQGPVLSDFPRIMLLTSFHRSSWGRTHKHPTSPESDALAVSSSATPRNQNSHIAGPLNHSDASQSLRACPEKRGTYMPSVYPLGWPLLCTGERTTRGGAR
jgi:hypothetical protein